MRIAFVGIEKDWAELEKRDYVKKFIQYHLELPYYYARDGFNSVDIVSNYEYGPFMTVQDYCPIEIIRPEKLLNRSYDVVVHWRKWIEECYRPEAINVINSQDRSYSPEWLATVQKASAEGKLTGILCFPTWHEQKLRSEMSYFADSYMPKLFSGVTLGVDTEVYVPVRPKKMKEMLWASDPGRGVEGAVHLAIELWKKDKEFKLHICFPDYVDSDLQINHPALEIHQCLQNGPELWGLFNQCGFLPYTSTFMEPSSRAHRQAMAAGCVVLYPPGKGTPSELLTHGEDSFVVPVEEWAEWICNLIENKSGYDRISNNARNLALSENWEVQAKRFNKLFEGML